MGRCGNASQALASPRNTVRRLPWSFPIPIRAACQVFAEHLVRAIGLFPQGFF
jgi:hypothetical protein